MIKLKKAIPIISAIGIMPIALVSCTQKYDYVSWSKGEKFTPTIEKYQPETGVIKSAEEASFVFKDLAKKNPKIISESIIESIASDEESGEHAEQRDIEKVSFAVTDVGFASIGEEGEMDMVANCRATLTGKFTINILGVDQTIELKDAQMEFSRFRTTFIYTFETPEDGHHFRFETDQRWPRKPEAINMPYFTWENGKIVIGKNKNWSSYDMDVNPITEPILSYMCLLFENAYISYFDNVTWGE